MARLSRRLILWIAGVLVGLLVLVVAAVIIAATLIDPNRYKPRIEALLQAQTGREIRLSGNLSWRVFPWLVVESGGGSVTNPAGLEGEAFAVWRKLELGVKLVPLFRREFVVRRIAIDGLDLRLKRNAAGEGNWSFAPAQPAAAQDAAADPTLQVDAAELTHSRVSFEDAKSGAHWVASDLELSLRIPSGAAAKTIRVEKLKLAAKLQGGPLAEQGVAFSFEAPSLGYDMEHEALQLPAYSAQFGGAEIAGSLAATLAPSLAASGKIDVGTSSLRELLAAAGIAAPPTVDAKVLGKFKLTSGFALKANQLTTEALALKLDDTQVGGKLELPSLSPLAVRFELQGDSIDADRYLEPEGTVSDPFELPLAQLKSLDAKGTLTFVSAKLAGAQIMGFKLTVE